MLDYATRFERYVSPEPNSGCWLWTGAFINSGYGVFRVGSLRTKDRRSKLAHRMAMELSGADVPADGFVLHKCDNKACVNPDHLYIGTRLDNARDAVERGRLRGPSMPGEKNPRARISEDDAKEIFSSDEPAAVLASRHGVTKTHVYDIKSKKAWGCLHAI